MSIFLLILGVILFICLVVVHEWGHFIAARRSGVDVEEFGIFFPPRLYKHKTKGGWDFTINALPLGGFVRLKGEHDNDKGKGSYGSASLGNKAKIMTAGVLMNVVAAFVILTALGWLGMPQLVSDQTTVKSDTKVYKVLIGTIESGSPAANAGLKSNDQLVSIAAVGQTPKPFTLNNTLQQTTRSLQGQKVDVTYSRNGQKHTVETKLLSDSQVLPTLSTNNPHGWLGMTPIYMYRSTWSAPVTAAKLMWQITGLTFKGLWSVVSGLAHGSTKAATANVSGPIGVVYILKSASHLGYQFILIIIAIISLSLAIMNILPIPALDGGRLFITLVYRAAKKTLKQRTEELINGTGLAVLLVLFVLISIVDIRRR